MRVVVAYFPHASEALFSRWLAELAPSFGHLYLPFILKKALTTEDTEEHGGTCVTSGVSGWTLLSSRKMKTSGKKKKKRSRAGGLHIAAGLRTVALFEAAKGILVIGAGLGLLSLIHHNAQAVAEEIVRHLHFNPASHLPRIFLDAAAKATDLRLWLMALTSMIYSLVRFVEAYGLWRQRVWAEWFGILSGSIYLPVELYELTVKVTEARAIVFLVNLFIVGWLSWIRWQERGSG